ncbi:MAG: metallophosphoesterase [Verrucomicrobiota bacterium]
MPTPVKTARFNRRQFFRCAFYGAPFAALADALWWEPDWLKVHTVKLTPDKPRARLVHFTDLHHKGDRAYLQKVVQRINKLSPDAVCFTGDLVEDAEHLPECLEVLQQIKSPLFGVPGNHDFWAEINFGAVEKAFASTGGAWLMDQQVASRAGGLMIHGATCNKPLAFRPAHDSRNILLIHYPAWVKKLGAKYDLVLAGHSHGGQVRVPFVGALVVPFGVDEFDLGLFQTAAGPLYVGAGIGCFYLNVRFNCRPEITVFEI